MKNKVAVLLTETEDGQFFVHIYENPDNVKQSFDQVCKTFGSMNVRTTLISLVYDGNDGVMASVSAKRLPILTLPATES